MSESADSYQDSYQEVGLMESGEPSFSGQQSVNMTKSEDQEKGQLKQLEFELAWKTRDEIIYNLNQHTKVLSGLMLKADAREKMRKSNNELVTVLMNLPPKVDGQLKSFESFKGSLDESLNEVVLDLSSEFRSRILDALTMNHSVSLMEEDSIANAFKSKLVDQNNDLACELLKLKSRTVEISSEPSKDDQLSELINELVNPWSPITEGLEELEVRVEELKYNHNCDNYDGYEATFNFELKEIEDLLAADAGQEKREYKLLTGENVPWCFSARILTREGVQYLAFHLQPNYSIIDAYRWIVLATFEVRLLGMNGLFGGVLGGLFAADAVAMDMKQVFKNIDYPVTTVDLPKVISLDKLLTGSFIREDTIKCRVKLSTTRFERSTYY